MFYKTMFPTIFSAIMTAPKVKFVVALYQKIKVIERNLCGKFPNCIKKCSFFLCYAALLIY